MAAPSPEVSSMLDREILVKLRVSTSVMSGDEVQKLETAGFDPRFPNTNQTKNCFVNFLDFHRCKKIKGEDYPDCDYFRKVFTSLCPTAWVEKWDEQLENGNFPAKI